MLGRVEGVRDTAYETSGGMLPNVTLPNCIVPLLTSLMEEPIGEPVNVITESPDWNGLGVSADAGTFGGISAAAGTSDADGAVGVLHCNSVGGGGVGGALKLAGTF